MINVIQRNTKYGKCANPLCELNQVDVAHDATHEACSYKKEN